MGLSPPNTRRILYLNFFSSFENLKIIEKKDTCSKQGYFSTPHGGQLPALFLEVCVLDGTLPTLPMLGLRTTVDETVITTSHAALNTWNTMVSTLPQSLMPEHVSNTDCVPLHAVVPAEEKSTTHGLPSM